MKEYQPTIGIKKDREQISRFIELEIVKAVESQNPAAIQFGELLNHYKTTVPASNRSDFNLDDVRDEISSRVISSYCPGNLNPETLLRAYILLSDYLYDVEGSEVR